MYRILHVGLGPLGQRIINDLHTRRLGQIAAAVDINPEIAGRPLSEIISGSPETITISNDIDALQDLTNIDCAIVTTSSDLATCADTFRKLLDQGISIVSTCEELLFPWLRHKALAEELDELAKHCNGRLLGTGINPGFLMDTLPVAASGVCNEIESVRCWRIQDATTRRIPFQAKIGATLSDAQFEAKIAEGTLRHVGLGESLHFIAHYLGLKIDRWDESIEPIKAEKDLECALGPIPKGHAAGVRQVGRGFNSDGRQVVRLEFVAAIGQAAPHDRVLIAGEPPIDLVIRGGVHGDIATSAMTLNSIGSLLAAKPGLHTMATIAPARCARPT